MSSDRNSISFQRRYWLQKALLIKYEKYQSPSWFRTYIGGYMAKRQHDNRTKTYLP